MQEGAASRSEPSRSPYVRAVVVGALACSVMLLIGWQENASAEVEAIDEIRGQLVAAHVPTSVIDQTLQPEFVSDDQLVDLSPGQVELVREAFYQARGEISTRDLVRHVLVTFAAILCMLAISIGGFFWLLADCQRRRHAVDLAAELDDDSESAGP